MAMNFDSALYLRRRGFLTPEKNKLLDIGPQNVYGLVPEQITEFIGAFGGANLSASALDLAKRKLVYYSTPRRNERTTFLSEVTDLVGIEYNSIDVCPGLKTEILDLNCDPLPEPMLAHYDVVLNFGTTEHVFNQWNCFEVMHDATKVGGVMYHQLPGTGYLDHGYYCYTPLLFKDMARANNYEILDLFVTHAGESNIDELKIPARSSSSVLRHVSDLGDCNRIPSLNIHAILRKTSEASFRTSLEVATAHASISRRVAAQYGIHESWPRAAMALFRKGRSAVQRLTTPRPY
jgi:hypothetical protein